LLGERVFAHVESVIAALDDLADALVRLDAGLDACDDETLTASLRRLAGLQSAFQAVWLRGVALAEQRSLHRGSGARDTASWVADIAGERRGAEPS
jgi:hypothetical protein